LKKIKNISHLLILLLFLNITNSFLNGFSFIEIVRSQTGILIFLIGIPIVVWSGHKLTTKVILDYSITLGVFSAFAFWYIWSQNHGLVILGNSRFALASEWTAFLGLAISLTSDTPHRIRSFTYSSSTIIVGILMLASLTRTNILLGLWILVISILIKSGKILNAFRIIILGISGYVVITTAIPDLLTNAAFVQRISESWSRFSSGGLSSSGLGSDESLVFRSMQTKIAMLLFKENPILGSGVLPMGQTLDTSVATLAQYGIIGSFILVCIFYKLYQILRSPFSPITSYVLPFFSALLPASFIYNWPGGRSIWIALGMALAISVSHQDSLASNKKESTN
jgi:hypothetical protein